MDNFAGYLLLGWVFLMAGLFRAAFSVLCVVPLFSSTMAVAEEAGQQQVPEFKVPDDVQSDGAFRYFMPFNVPKTLSYQMTLFGPISADVRHVEYSIASNSLSSFIIALPILMTGVVIILIMIAPIKKLSISTIFAQSRPARAHRPKVSTLYILGLLACVICALQFMVPIIMLTLDVFPAADSLLIVRNNTEVIFNSVASAAIAAVVSVLLALGVLPMLKTWQRLMLILIP